MTRRWQMPTASTTSPGQYHLKRRIPDKEITSRFRKNSQALGRLRTKVLNHHYICLSTKRKVYRAVVLTALLCECETWTRYRRRVKQLETFHMCALCSILGMHWQDRIKNLEVLDRAECTSIEALLIKPSCDGWDKSSEWTILACPVNYCMESLCALQGHCEGEPSVVRHPAERT